MTRQEIEKAIESELAARRKQVLNRNAVTALFGAFTDPVGALGKIFLGRDDALETERQRIEQGVVIELLCKIDAALTQAAVESSNQGILICGLIETTVESADSVVGVHISEGMTNVTLAPGTHIHTVVTNAKDITGLQIGGKLKSD